MRNPVPLKDLLGKAVKRAGIEREVTVAQLLEAANAVILTLLPPGHGNDAKAIALCDGFLHVTCLNAAASFVVNRDAMRVMDAVKRAAPRADVRRVVTRIEAGHTRPSGVVE